MKQKLKIDASKNNLVFGDCKDWLPYIPSNSINLIYIDPPFFSNQDYEIIWGNGHEKRSFTDRWKGGIEHYIGWMRERLIEANRVLKKTGIIMVHCDWHANHKIRCLLDELFGSNNFVNEVIWCYDVGGRSKKMLARKHDTIYVYSKSKTYFFNEKESKKYGKKRKTGSHSRGGILGIDENGRPYQDKKASSGKYYRYYLDEKKIPEDWIVLNSIQSSDKERVGYDTQKPEKLLKILISSFSSSEKNHVVLDFFGGGGTTAKVCCDLNRKFITGDVSPVAYRVIQDRLINNGYENFETPNPPLTKEEWLTINDREYEKKICMFMGWDHNPSSKPVDGWADKNKKIPVEIKNHTGTTDVGDIRKLAGVMGELGLKKGIFVSWIFSKGCFEYVAKIGRTEKKEIELISAHTIIGNLVLTKSQREKYQRLYEECVKKAKQKVQILKTG